MDETLAAYDLEMELYLLERCSLPGDPLLERIRSELDRLVIDGSELAYPNDLDCVLASR
jgi:hypothetical protein